MPMAKGLCLAERAMLQDLANHSDPPRDVDLAAELLRRWMPIRLDDKPTAHFVCNEDRVGFLAWLLRETGAKPYRLIKQTHPEEAAEIRRQVLVLCFWRANTCFRLSGYGLAMMGAKKIAEACLDLPEFVLGAEDAKF